MKDQLKALYEERGRLVTDQRGIYEKAETEKRSVTAEEVQAFESMEARYLQVEKDIANLEKVEQRQAQFAKSQFETGNKSQAGEGSKEENEKRYATAFEKYIRYGMGELDADERRMITSQYQKVEVRAQSTTGSAGGYLIPVGFSGEIERFMKYYGPMLSAGRIQPTSNGNTYNWPTNNDTGNTGALIGENADHSDTVTDLTFANVAFGSYTFGSKLIKASNESLEDADIPLDGILFETLGERLGRVLNTYFTTGTGSSQPQGVVAGAGNSSVTAAVDGLTFDNLIDLQHSVDLAYRTQGKWMLNDATLKVIRKLKDGNSNYIWQMYNVQTGQPATILGQPYFINNDMATIAANAKTVLFGDFSKFVIRQIKGITLARANERYIEYNQTGFMAIARYDSKVMNNTAIKYLAHAAS